MNLKHITIQPHCYKKPPFSVEVPDCKPIEGETIPRRHPSAIDGLKSQPEPGIETLYDVFLRSAEKFGDLNAVGTRTLIKIHNEVKKEMRVVDGEEKVTEKNWEFFEMSGYEYLTFREHKIRALEIGSGMRKLGLGLGDRVHIFAGTSANWLLTAHAAISQSLPIVTSYATLGIEGLIHSLLQTNAKLIFVDPSLLDTLITPLKSAKSLQFVIYNSDLSLNQADLTALQSAHPHIQILPLSTLLTLGQTNPADPVPPHPQDLATIMYTSGSTGPPKGVPFTHAQILAAITGIDVALGPYLSPSDSVLAYLPLAHSFEFAFENTAFYWGMCMGYGNPRTLSPVSMRGCEGDIKEFGPSVLVGVPAVWETLKKGIEARVASRGWLERGVFNGALGLKAFWCDWGLPGAGLFDYLVFNQIKKEMGGRMRACFCGAGSLGKETRRWVGWVISPLIMGYGLTETTAMGTLQDPLEWTDDTLGAPSPCVEIKLVSSPSLNYLSTSTPPQGEILIRGPAVMSGYYLNEEETKEAFDEDGWFRTGDIGEWAPNGHLKIVDRRKNLVKGLGGEYIALEKLESIYRQSAVVANICIYASADRARPVAIVVPATSVLVKIAANNGVETHDLDRLVKNEKVKGAVLKELQNAGRKAGLAGFEIVDGVILTDLVWTIQNELLTPAQKLNRRVVVKHYQRDLDEAKGRVKSLL